MLVWWVRTFVAWGLRTHICQGWGLSCSFSTSPVNRVTTSTCGLWRSPAKPLRWCMAGLNCNSERWHRGPPEDALEPSSVHRQTLPSTSPLPQRQRWSLVEPSRGWGRRQWCNHLQLDAPGTSLQHQPRPSCSSDSQHINPRPQCIRSKMGIMSCGPSGR